MHRRIKPALSLLKKEMFSGITDFYTLQFFLKKFQTAPYFIAIMLMVGKFYNITKRSNTGLRHLTVIIHPLVWDDHLHFKGHLISIFFASLVEKMANVGDPAAFSTDGHCRFNERFFRQGAQKHDSIKEI